MGEFHLLLNVENPKKKESKKKRKLEAKIKEENLEMPKLEEKSKCALFPSFYRERVTYLHLMQLFLIFFEKKKGNTCSLKLLL